MRVVNENGNATGDFDVTDAVVIRGDGASRTVIDAQRRDRLFDVDSSFSARFVDVALRHGAGPNNGAGIQVVDADVTLVRCVVSDNFGLVGGGINAEGGSVTLVGTTVCRNVSQGDGGGVRVGSGGTLTATSSSFRRNISGREGGGIHSGSVTLTNCSVSGNTAGTNDGNAGGGGILAEDATLTNCMVSGNTAADSGGGVDARTTILTGCTVSGNIARGGNGGGGVRAFEATLTDSTVRGNASNSNGGGIIAEDVTLTNCTVSGNSTREFGGGIRCGEAILSGCTISGNSGLGGGGIHAEAVTLTNCMVSGNTTGGFGGGISANDNATLTNCTVSGNVSDRSGGGVFAADATLTNCTISGNSARDEGGGVATIRGTLTNCTITENSAHTGGGVFHWTSVPGTITVKNTIIAQNLVDSLGGGPDASGTFQSLGRNLIGIRDGSTGFIFEPTFNIPFDLTGIAANPLDPRLGPLVNNGGRTLTHALLAGSPAIDQGNSEGVPPTDHAGPDSGA